MRIQDLIEKLKILQSLHGNVEVVGLPASSSGFIGVSGLPTPIELTEPRICKIISNENFDPHSNREPEELAVVTNLQNYGSARKAVYIMGH